MAEYNTELGKAIEELTVSSKVLFWLEILSVANRLSDGIYLLKSAIEWCNITCLGAQRILNDSYRFLLYFREAISQGPIHIYKSALPFIPKCDLYASANNELRATAPQLKFVQEEEWSPLLFTLQGHTGVIICS
ncbi:hypothetical protein FRC03_004793 [Tulasnella sp. 419]|nr:hypothetical protein FRC03_004793 [Tulasnella sp. 419]